MTIADFFYITASIAIWVTIITGIVIFYKINRIIAIAELKAKSVKDMLKLSGLTLLSKILESTKGGEANDKQK